MESPRLRSPRRSVVLARCRGPVRRPGRAPPSCLRISWATWRFTHTSCPVLSVPGTADTNPRRQRDGAEVGFETAVLGSRGSVMTELGPIWRRIAQHQARTLLADYIVEGVGSTYTVAPDADLSQVGMTASDLEAQLTTIRAIEPDTKFKPATIWFAILAVGNPSRDKGALAWCGRSGAVPRPASPGRPAARVLRHHRPHEFLRPQHRVGRPGDLSTLSEGTSFRSG